MGCKMTVLVTNFKQNMQDKDGFLSVQEMLEAGCSSHIFKGCLKIKPAPEDENFCQWLAYWQGFPYAILCTVTATKFPNGDTKVTILTKELKTLEEVGEYPSKNNSVFGDFIDGKFVSTKNLQKYVNDVIVPTVKAKIVGAKKPSTNAVKEEHRKLSNEKINEFQRVITENWGCKFKG